MRSGTKKSGGRGRPRKFNESAALDAAVSLFTEKGYSAASLDDLASAMAMNRPSMYNAFGNKEAIYQRAIQHYVDQIALPLSEALSNEGIETAFEQFFQTLLDIYCSDQHGCMATSTLPVESKANTELRAVYTAITQKIDGLLQETLEQHGLSEGALLSAQLIQALMQTMSLRVRAGAKRQDLEALYRFGLAKILAV